MLWLFVLVDGRCATSVGCWSRMTRSNNLSGGVSLSVSVQAPTVFCSFIDKSLID